MSEAWTIGKSRFKRPIQAALAAAALLYASWLSFDAAEGLLLPPDPASLHSVTMQVDKVAECPYSDRIRVGSQTSWRSPRCLYSNAYPGAALEVRGAAARYTFEPPIRLDLLIDRDPAANLANEYHGKMASVFTRIGVYGLRQDGTWLADPAAQYQSVLANKQGKKRNGWLLILAALGALAYAYRQARKVFKDNPYLW